MQNNSKTPVIVGIGELLWDVMPTNTRLGGAPANFAIHCQSLGGKSAIISSVGNDKPGKEILSQLRDANINTNYINTCDHQTGWVDVTIDNNGIPEYTIHTNVAWDHITLNETHIQLAQKCNAVCFGSLAQRNTTSKSSIFEFLQNTTESCLKIFDINLRQNYYSRQLIADSLKYANILKLNDNELTILQQMFNLPSDTKPAIQTLIEQYDLGCLALTLGENGSILANKSNFHHQPSIPVNISDTIGAGDSFTAALTMGLLKKIDLETINQTAGKIAAFVCSQPGATPSLPNDLADELKDRSICDSTSTR